MRPPREPKRWKYPRLYVGFNRKTGEIHRMRLLYPNGMGDWFGPGDDSLYEGFAVCEFACWASLNGDLDLSSRERIDQQLAERSLENLKEYVAHRYPGTKLVYIGEIK